MRVPCPVQAHSYKPRFKCSRWLVTLPHSRSSRPWKGSDSGRPQGRRAVPLTHAAVRTATSHTCGSMSKGQCTWTHRHLQMSPPLSLLETEYLLSSPSHSFSFMGRIPESLQWKKLNETCDLHLLKKKKNHHLNFTVKMSANHLGECFFALL